MPRNKHMRLCDLFRYYHFTTGNAHRAMPHKRNGLQPSQTRRDFSSFPARRQDLWRRDIDFGNATDLGHKLCDREGSRSLDCRLPPSGQGRRRRAREIWLGPAATGKRVTSVPVIPRRAYGFLMKPKYRQTRKSTKWMIERPPLIRGVSIKSVPKSGTDTSAR